MSYVVPIGADDVVVDNTILKSVASCSTQAALLYVLGRTTAEEAKQLLAGQYAHEVLAWWLLGRDDEAALDRLDPYRRWASDKVPADDPLAYANVRKILRNWLKRHPVGSFEVRVEADAIEVPMAAELAVVQGQRVVMVALLDALGKRRTGGRWSVDHKTTRNVNEWFIDGEEDSSQFTGQLWIAKQHGMLLAGVYINAIEFWKVPGSDRRCASHGTPYSECGLQHLKHRLWPITRSAHEIETWERTAVRLAKRFLVLRARVKTAEDVRTLPMEGRFTRACRNCQFRDWCRMGRPKGAMKSFLHHPWDPIARAAEHVAAVAAGRAVSRLRIRSGGT